MTTMISLTKYEHQIIPKLRDQLNQSESVEDVKKFFVAAVQEFFHFATEGRLSIDYDSVSLLPDSEPYYLLSVELQSDEEFKKFADSDLDSVLTRIAEQAAHRHKHLEKNNTKTKLKIRGH